MRQEGYYWVKYEDVWMVGFFNGDKQKFELTMCEEYFKIDEFDEVDDVPLSRT